MEVQPIIQIRGITLYQSGGRSSPRFLCQFCGEFINRAGDAFLVWNPKEGEALCVHRGCYREHGDPCHWALDIGTMLVYLLWNIGIEGQEALGKWEEIAKTLAHV